MSLGKFLAAGLACVAWAASLAPAATPDEVALFGGGPPVLGSGEPENRLYRLGTAPATPAAFVGRISFSSFNGAQVDGLASDPTSGSARLWGISVSDPTAGGGTSFTNELLLINPATGAGAFVGETLLPFSTAIYDLAYQVSTGRMFGVSLDGDLYSIDPLTAAPTRIGPTGVGALEGLGAGAGDKLFGTDRFGKLYLVDTLTGQATFAANLGTVITDLASRPTDGVMFGVRVNTATGEQEVVTIDTTTGAVGFVTGTNLYAIARTDDRAYHLYGAAFAPVPEPSGACLLFLGGGLAWRSRRQFSIALLSPGSTWPADDSPLDPTTSITR